jgi:hypothetical protein
MRLLLVFVLFLLIVPSVRAGLEQVVLSDPAGVEELEVEITQYGSVAVSGDPTSVEVFITIPQDDERQDVDMEITKRSDDFGSLIGYFSENDPANPYQYSVSGKVVSRAYHLTDLPETYKIPQDVEMFLEATDNIQSGDSEIRRLAEDLTKDSRDDFEKIADLAIWVNDYLDYDISYSGKTNDALQVLLDKKGVCAEYTTLFTALARSIGFPTRYISAYAYGDYGWERHAYAEVYLGKWVPVDALWLEIGFMDATHIRFGNHLDNRVANEVQFKGYNIGGINWLLDETDIVIDSYSNVTKGASFDLEVSSGIYREGDKGVVFMSFVPDEYMVARIDMIPCAGQFDIVSMDDMTRKIVFRPGEEQVIAWTFEIDQDLPANHLFTCPLTLNSRSFKQRTVDVRVNTQLPASQTKTMFPELESNVVRLGETQKVFVDVENAGSVTVGIIADDAHDTWDISGDGRIAYEFTPETTGTHEVIVYSSNGELETEEYEVVSDAQISIEDFSYPEYLRKGKEGLISASITASNISSVKLETEINGEKDIESISVQGNYKVNVPVVFEDTGAKKISLTARASGIEISKSGTIVVYEKPEVEVLADYEEGTGRITVSARNSRMKNVTLTIAGQEFYLGTVSGEKVIELGTSPGTYEAEIVYSDLGGANYRGTVEIEFQEKNWFDQVIGFLDGIAKGIYDFFAGLFRE